MLVAWLDHFADDVRCGVMPKLERLAEAKRIAADALKRLEA